MARSSAAEKTPPVANEPDAQAFKAFQLSKIMRSAEDLASANGQHRNVLKTAEAKGVDLKAAKLALQVRKSDDPEAFVASLRNTLDYCVILGIGLTREQLELFPTASDPRTPLEDRAYEDGLRAGRLALSTDENPHHPSVEAHAKWMNGFHQGTADRNALLALEAEHQAELIEGPGHDAGGDLDEAEA